MVPDPGETVRDDGSASRAIGGWRQELMAYAELLATTWLAIAQPVLDTFGKGAETFVFRRAGPVQIVLFTATVTFGPALVLYLVEIGLALGAPKLRPLAHRVLVVIPVAVFAAEVLVRAVELPLWMYWVAAVAAATSAFALLWLARPAHLFLRFLALAPPIAAVAFLVVTPVADVAWASAPRTNGGVRVDNPVPVVMIVYDELPTASLLDVDGQIDADLFPSFARLASDATWYPNHSTVSPTTPEAVPALLTGEYPDSVGKVPVTAEHPDNLFTLLDGAYEMNVWEQATQLCPDDTCPTAGTISSTGFLPLIGDAVDVFRDLLVRDESVQDEKPFRIRQSDPAAPRHFQEFTESVADADGARLDFVHAVLPHQPWRHLPSGSRYNGEFLAEGLDGTYSWRDEYFAQAARQRHLLQLQRADVLLGDLLDRLEEQERFEESLVVVTSDHGVSFTGREPIRGISEGNEEQIMWSPLLIKEPGQREGAVDPRPMQSIDVLPTIADILGIDLPFEVDGRSVLGQPRDVVDDQRRIYRWEGFSELETLPGEEYALVDGPAAFERLLDLEPWPSLTTGDHRLYAFGEYGSLVGQSVDQLTHGEDAPFGAIVHDPDRSLRERGVDLTFDEVDIDDEVVPTYVSGVAYTLDRVDVVVAVNGTIGGWGPAFDDRDQPEGSQSFFALVPEALLAESGNRIELYSVTGGADRPVLHRIEVS